MAVTRGGPQSAEAVFARLGRNMDSKSQTLLKIHVRRALIHVAKCRCSGLEVLDCCGEEGDLFFLLKCVSEAVGLQALEQTLRGMCEIMVRHVDVAPLSLSKRELATMAAQPDPL